MEIKSTYGVHKYAGAFITGITLDKVYLVCTEIFKSKPTINDAGFISY